MQVTYFSDLSFSSHHKDLSFIIHMMTGVYRAGTVFMEITGSKGYFIDQIILRDQN